MALSGKLFRITNMQQFVLSFITTGGNPTVGFTDFGRARVHLALLFPNFSPVGPEFLPSTSIKVDTNASGAFTINLPSLPNNVRGQLVAFRNSGNVSVPTIGGTITVPIFEPIYRTTDFSLQQIPGSQLRIFVNLASTPDEQGFTQQELNDQMDTIRQDMSLGTLRGTIRSNRIGCRATKSGGRVEFDVRVRPDTSTNLSTLVVARAEDIEIHPPEPAIITGLCVNEDEIERPIRRAVRGMGKTFSDRIFNAISAASPNFDVAANASITVTHIRFPVTGTQMVTVAPGVTIPIDTRSIVPDVAIGFPRTLIAP